MATDAYPISTPVEFTTTAPGDVINMNATTGLNVVMNLVGTNPGDLLYRTGTDVAGLYPLRQNFLDRLPIGAPGQLLTVSAGLPSWQNAPAVGQTVFSATVSSAPTAIPQNDAWTTLANTPTTYVVWDDTTLPNTDTSGVFNPSTGVFTVPTTGVYDIAASINFEGDNSGTLGLIVTAPVGRATRQARLFNSTTAVPISIATRQAEASTNNTTQCVISAKSASLVAGNQIVLQARHDASVSLSVISSLAAPQTWFSATRVA